VPTPKRVKGAMVNKMLEQLGVKPAKPMAILAGLAEFVGGILVILGFLTPLAALALIVVMIVAVLMVHLETTQPTIVTRSGLTASLRATPSTALAAGA